MNLARENVNLSKHGISRIFFFTKEYLASREILLFGCAPVILSVWREVQFKNVDVISFLWARAVSRNRKQWSFVLISGRLFRSGATTSYSSQWSVRTVWGHTPPPPWGNPPLNHHDLVKKRDIAFCNIAWAYVIHARNILRVIWEFRRRCPKG